MRLLKTIRYGFAVLALLGTQALAENYPVRPITLIVPFAAGGPSDAIARQIGQSMSKTLGQQLVVENVGGAGGTLGAARLARAEPDGYTILIHHIALAAGQSLYPKLEYDTRKAFAPIGLVNTGPMVLLSRNDMEAKDAATLLTMMREKGENISLGHAGVGSNAHLCALLLQDALKVKFTLAAYQGTGPAMNDLMSGKLDMLCDQSTTSIPQIKGATVKGYAVTSPKRLEALADLPTLQEAGLPDFSFTVWHGLYAPAGTLPEIVDKLNNALQVALDDKTLQQRFRDVGTTVFPADERTPAAHEARFQAEIETWARVLKEKK